MAGVDKTGLDILCSGSGDVYHPPGPDGKSLCIFADGTLVLCDSNTDKCIRVYVREVQEDGKPSVDGLTFRLLKLVKELSDRVDRLESKTNA